MIVDCYKAFSDPNGKMHHHEEIDDEVNDGEEKQGLIMMNEMMMMDDVSIWGLVEVEWHRGLISLVYSD